MPLARAPPVAPCARHRTTDSRAQRAAVFFARRTRFAAFAGAAGVAPDERLLHCIDGLFRLVDDLQAVERHDTPKLELRRRERRCSFRADGRPDCVTHSPASAVRDA
ncbi:hypothetical protein [Burkholderia sp. SCN-KJ]|uniref:hypothetical protein n=1 Tax=Burkholderia sp. SCN-KJ TaxID=2969248 RepID=UPI00214F9D81|nr:hypothetical protein [Burkholderia sp. SCN-KJ]MCR4465802.1 hypothetical protein [Burkholderia sp. SCN-KJ]